MVSLILAGRRRRAEEEAANGAGDNKRHIPRRYEDAAEAQSNPHSIAGRPISSGSSSSGRTPEPGDGGHVRVASGLVGCG